MVFITVFPLRKCVKFKKLKNNKTLLLFTEADKLCGKLYQKLNLLLGQKIVMDHMPLLMVCLEVIFIILMTYLMQVINAYFNLYV